MQSNDDRMMTRVEAAQYLGLRPATLEAWASRGGVKLPFSKLGRAVRYRKRDLDRFIESNRATVTAKRS
ncbi:MAG: helix-turn-helix domain-containing protein [Planctomycetota bacterium]|nr:helix-turn-helix domain-containing protein [Planctomycetota bacterium]MDA0921043.1 helix-turn-helix domain-containing protein [Planctomycetota bacterium]MDA1160270.1 helix-turn-helix domain-containing protein [Planctomycetota bacterium]